MARTRRHFLLRVGQVGGYSAAFIMMHPTACCGHDTRVVILGGGMRRHKSRHLDRSAAARSGEICC